MGQSSELFHAPTSARLMTSAPVTPPSPLPLPNGTFIEFGSSELIPNGLHARIGRPRAEEPSAFRSYCEVL